MSRTMFWYVMKDLLKIFLMTAGVLGAMMSFGGLFKPLMQFDLNGAQVVQILLYFMPATQTYSLSISALFATTIVYGRLSADNELTACRATGISTLAMAAPAFLLGLVLALVSLISLSYVVPYYTLQVEKVVYKSVARVAQQQIQRSHRIKLKMSGTDFVIYADSAELRPAPAENPEDEVIRLISPMFCLVDKLTDAKTKAKIDIPGEFYTAKSAVVVIHRTKDRVEFSARLEDGVKFPRELDKGVGGMAAAQIGPVELPQSIIRQNTKFMNVTQLQEMYIDPLHHREIIKLYADAVSQSQEQQFIDAILKGLRETGECRFDNAPETYILSLLDTTRSMFKPGKAKDPKYHNRLNLSSVGQAKEIRLKRLRNGQEMSVDDAQKMVLKVQADTRAAPLMQIQFGLEDVSGKTEEGGQNRQSLPRPFAVPMPAHLAALEQVGPDRWVQGVNLLSKDDSPAKRLLYRLLTVRNGIASELHGRSSFAISCLILVIMGSALGMMFRTGNFLNAFALSVIPALLCIALVVTGEHVAEAGPDNLRLGLGLIWSGNVIVLGMAIWLLGRLQRQ